MKLIELEAAIESILFAAGEPVSVKSIADSLKQDTGTAKALVNNLMDKYSSEKRGIKIIQIGDSFQMCTNSNYFEYIKDLYSAPRKKQITPALLETLAIIAYKQPVTKSGIEDIRGVNADHAVNTLMKYNLVEEKGRLDAPGKPILLGTTDEFLRYFGFSSLDSLPSVDTDYNTLKIEAENEADKIS